MKIEIKDSAVLNDGKQIGRIDGDRFITAKHPGPKALGAINSVHGSKLKLDILPENAPKGTDEGAPLGEADGTQGSHGPIGPRGTIGPLGGSPPFDVPGFCKSCGWPDGECKCPPARVMDPANPEHQSAGLRDKLQPTPRHDPEPKQDPMKGTRDPEWKAWKARQ